MDVDQSPSPPPIPKRRCSPSLARRARDDGGNVPHPSDPANLSAPRHVDHAMKRRLDCRVRVQVAARRSAEENGQPLTYFAAQRPELAKLN